MNKRSKSEMKIAPILVRKSAIKVEGLETVQIIPPDLIPVNGDGVSRLEREKRDFQWNVVFEQIQAITEAQKKTL